VVRAESERRRRAFSLALVPMSSSGIEAGLRPLMLS